MGCVFVCALALFVDAYLQPCPERDPWTGIARQLETSGAYSFAIAQEEGDRKVMKPLWEAADFVRNLHRRLRFGELSRAPLKLLRLELRGDEAECEWMARPPDPWDAYLPPSVGEHHASVQALEDSLAVRNLLFYAIPALSRAVFRVYRQAEGEHAELIITGTVTREDQAAANVCSLAMRAKLCGLKFWLTDGVLGTFHSEGCAGRS